ncbi:MAG TPA: beta-ketoacyl-ACP synthase III [Bacteroidia bacterium]|jgi:3-oxoacyl-[acyl-carrier-protein] synthase-3|nr:beta-ketoacyl-ACP synthase III [Bacteroidia bacterium]
MSRTRAAITGVAGWLPETVLSNKDLEKMVDTTDEWILSRTGIKERRILKGENMGVSEICVNAVRKLLEKKKIDPMEVDMLIVGTVTPDHIFPSTSNIVCDKLGMKKAWGFDLSAACSGFLYALATGTQFIETGRYKKVIVVGADKMSAIIDYADRATCIIFGDGGGAVLLEPTTADEGVMDFDLHADGSGIQYLYAPAGGSKRPASHETVDNKMHYVKQEGQAVFKYAVANMAEVSAKMMEKNNLKPEDVAYLVPHQANKRIVDATAHRMGVGPEKVMMNIERYGNTTAGTIPLLLMDYESKLKKGDNLILSAFGGGFTWGAIWVKWAYDTK